MICCDKCKRVLGTVEHSSEINVRGEIKLNIFCQWCQEVKEIVLFEYKKKRGVL